MKSKVALIVLTSCLLLTAVGVGRQQQQAANSSAQESQAASASERKISQMAESLRPRLIAQRRDFHIHPELSNREERTARVVAERLRELKFDEVKTNVARHGVVGILRGGRPGATIAVRADMDALPINETINVPYRSQNAGVKHACGHDVHTSIELGVAEILSSMRAEIPGTIKFIFQPAEEGAPAGEEGGAALMIKEGVLENPRPQAIFGLHVLPNVEVGQVAYNSGAAMASSDKFIITVRGRKVHGAYPHDGVDAVTVAANCITALQTIRSRRVDTTEPLVLSIGIVQGGNRFNIIADEVKLEGTVRTLNEDVRKRVQTLMRETLAGVTSAYGASFEMQYEEGAAVTYNDPSLVEETLPVMRRVLGANNLITRKPQMGAEDFSYFQKVIPGFFYFLG
ncbi:MAG: amidohydrolase, partial [Pyrinomonadaceae bacterium]|nr:amidohydrolase [Pyrinomonadaceae bacterium]